MKKMYFYGIEYYNCNISESEFLELSRLMFLSSSFGLTEVEEILKNLSVISESEIEELKENLTEEIEYLREKISKMFLFGSANNSLETKQSKKLEDWLIIFKNITKEEIEEFKDFYYIIYK